MKSLAGMSFGFGIVLCVLGLIVDEGPLIAGSILVGSGVIA
jgi:hypothetical protein